MYLRFQYRIPRRRTALGRAFGDAGLRESRRQPSLVAIVSESRRTDGGAPRQYLVKYLGSIRRDDVHRVAGRQKFWDRVDKRLAGFTSADRERFVAALAALVPRLTTEEVVALFKPTEEMLHRAQQIEGARAKMKDARAARANQEGIAS